MHPQEGFTQPLTRFARYRPPFADTEIIGDRTTDIVIASEDPRLAIARLQENLKPPDVFQTVRQPDLADISEQYAPAREFFELPLRGSEMSTGGQFGCDNRSIASQDGNLNVFVRARLSAAPHIQRPAASDAPSGIEIGKPLGSLAEAPWRPGIDRGRVREPLSGPCR
jgi:hypothetical protein